MLICVACTCVVCMFKMSLITGIITSVSMLLLHGLHFILGAFGCIFLTLNLQFILMAKYNIVKPPSFFIEHLLICWKIPNGCI